MSIDQDIPEKLSEEQIRANALEAIEIIRARKNVKPEGDQTDPVLFTAAQRFRGEFWNYNVATEGRNVLEDITNVNARPKTGASWFPGPLQDFLDDVRRNGAL